MSELHSSQLASDLDIYLQCERMPVGIQFLYGEADYQEHPYQVLSGPITYCVGVKKAMQKNSFKMSLDTCSCLAGARATGLLKKDQDICSESDIISGRRLFRMGLHKDPCTARQIAKSMQYCAHSVHGIAFAPLSDYEQSCPDVVILVCEAKKAMRLIQAHSYFFGPLSTVQIIGNQALCHECTSYVFETNQMNISMLCAGTRRVAKWRDSELAVGIPYGKLEGLIEGLKQTVNPMDDDETKEAIKLKAEAYAKPLDITLRKKSNYFTGGFGTLQKYKQNKA